jgi:hypothetical protein
MHFVQQLEEFFVIGVTVRVFSDGVTENMGSFVDKCVDDERPSLRLADSSFAHAQGYNRHKEDRFCNSA